ncbi:MAG TPA: serine/threonine-protein kinase [Polyangiales bacterium]|nr:serine/threonine-protein kinase [Polyangiales bacterium]
MSTARYACPECGSEYLERYAHCPRDGSKLGVRDALCGRELSNRYRVICKIGNGAMSAVYAADDLRLEKRVAIKLLHAEVAGGPQAIDRFKREARALSKLRSEHIIDVYDFHDFQGSQFIVMELLRGEDLEAVVARSGALPIERVGRIVDQCCRALEAAHSKGVVHRDLKPANIFLAQQDGRADYVKLLDFGVAKMMAPDGSPLFQLTRVGETWGTPCYMSPEQAEGMPADRRSDVYALGVVMFELLTGSVPFEGQSHVTILQKQVEEPPPPMRADLDVPAAVEDVVLKALAKHPDERYDTMSDLNAAFRQSLHAARKDDLQAALSAYTVPAPSAQIRGRLASIDPDLFDALEDLRAVLLTEHQYALRVEREENDRRVRALEERIHEGDRRNR